MQEISVITERIVSEKKKNNGRVPWGFTAKLLGKGQSTFTNMSMRTTNNYMF